MDEGEGRERLGGVTGEGRRRKEEVRPSGDARPARDRALLVLASRLATAAADDTRPICRVQRSQEEHAGSRASSIYSSFLNGFEQDDRAKLLPGGDAGAEETRRALNARSSTQPSNLCWPASAGSGRADPGALYSFDDSVDKG